MAFTFHLDDWSEATKVNKGKWAHGKLLLFAALVATESELVFTSEKQFSLPQEPFVAFRRKRVSNEKRDSRPLRIDVYSRLMRTYFIPCTIEA